MVKTAPAKTLDLASIAKGFGVDQGAFLLKSQGFTDFLEEIGGEVVAAALSYLTAVIESGRYGQGFPGGQAGGRIPFKRRPAFIRGGGYRFG